MAKKMEPDLAVATNVNIRKVDVFNVRGYKKTKAVAFPAKVFVLPIFLICAPRLATPTTVMAVFTSTLVTIGADGLGTYRLEGKTIPIKACKVLATEDTVYVASGDIPERIRENVLAVGDWFAASDNSLNSSALKLAVESMMSQKRVNDPARYSKYRPGAKLLTILAARPNHGKVQFRATIFVVTQFQSVAASQHDIKTGIAFDSAATNYLPPVPTTNITKADPLKLIRAGIRGAFERPDSFSGPPITIVQITTKKIHWVAYGNCKHDGSNAWDTTPPAK